MKTNKTKETISMDLVIDERFLSKKGAIPALKKAASKVVNSLHNGHFNPKNKQGWPLSYSFYKEEIFYEAFGHHLEDYLLTALAKKNAYNLVSSPEKELRIVKRKKSKKKSNGRK